MPYGITPNPDVWFDAAQDSFADGAAVDSWTDRSGGAHHATQATSSKRPTFATTGALGRFPAVTFDGGDCLACSFGASFAQPNTFFVVGAMTAVGYFWDGITSTDRNGLYGGFPAAGQLSMYAGTAGDPVVALALPLGWGLWTCEFNGASSALRLNGVSQDTGSPGSHAATGMTLGGRYSQDANFLTGAIAEVLVYNPALSSSDRATVEAALLAKYDQFRVSLAAPINYEQAAIEVLLLSPTTVEFVPGGGGDETPRPNIGQAWPRP